MIVTQNPVLWSFVGFFIFSPIMVLLSALSLWLVSHIIKFIENDFRTALGVSLVMFVVNVIISRIKHIIDSLFNLNFGYSFEAIILTVLPLLFIQAVIGIFIIREIYETTGLKAIGAYLLHWVFLMTVGGIILYIISFAMLAKYFSLNLM